MKPLSCAIFALTIIGCAKETVKPDPTFKSPRESHVGEYHLFKNDITDEFYLTKETYYFFGGVRGVRNSSVYEGDSVGCINYIRAEQEEKRRQQEEKEREWKIKQAWHELDLSVVMDSAAAQTDRELKTQIDKLTKVPK